MDGTRGHISLGRYFGIELRLSYSWFIIFGLIAWSLIAGFYPTQYPGLGTVGHFAIGLLATVFFFLSVIVHEFSHALVAKAQGLEIRRITFFLFGGAAELLDEPETPLNELVMAAIGPITSLTIGGIFQTFAFFNERAGGPLWLEAFLIPVALLNIVVGIFNMVPGFPLDGGRVLRSILWHFTDDLKRATKIAAIGGAIVGFGLIFLGITRLLGGFIIGGGWLILLGWYLSQIAGLSYEQTVARLTLRQCSAEDIMRPSIAVDADLSINAWLRDYAQRLQQRDFPVKQSGKLVGIVQFSDVEGLRDPAALRKPVRSIMKEINEERRLSASDSADRAYRLLRQEDITSLPVTRDGETVGIVNQESIEHYLALRAPFVRD